MNKETSLKLAIKNSWAFPLHATTAHLKATQSHCVAFLSFFHFLARYSGQAGNCQLCHELSGYLQPMSSLTKHSNEQG